MKKWVLITGCDSGFGADLLDKLVSNGGVFDGIFACFHRPESVENYSKNNSFFFHPIVLDICHDKSVDEMVTIVSSTLADTKGVLAAVVNNAGGLETAGPIEWTEINSDINQMNLNFFGQVRVTRGLLPLVRQASQYCSPRIVFTSSLMGLVAAPFGGSYAASKFALEGWCDSLRREMLCFGISVHLVEPGVFCRTKFYDQYSSLVPIRIPPGYGDQYREYCINRLCRLKNFFGSINSRVEVAHAFLHALTAKFPKYRYRVGYDSWIVGSLFSWLPTIFSDLAITVCDTVILFDRRMTPALPESSRFTTWTNMVTFSILHYNQSWMFVVCFILAIIIFSF